MHIHFNLLCHSCVSSPQFWRISLFVVSCKSDHSCACKSDTCDGLAAKVSSSPACLATSERTAEWGMGGGAPSSSSRKCKCGLVSEFGAFRFLPLLHVHKAPTWMSLVKRGMTRQWGKTEFAKRRMDKRYKSDNDPDCKLPRVQACGKTFDIEVSENSITDLVEVGTDQIKRPQAKQMNQLLDNLGADVYRDSAITALRTGDDDALFIDFKSSVNKDQQGFSAKSFLADQFKAISPETPTTGCSVSAVGTSGGSDSEKGSTMTRSWLSNDPQQISLVHVHASCIHVHKVPNAKHKSNNKCLGPSAGIFERVWLPWL